MADLDVPAKGPLAVLYYTRTGIFGVFGDTCRAEITFIWGLGVAFGVRVRALDTADMRAWKTVLDSELACSE